MRAPQLEAAVEARFVASMELAGYLHLKADRVNPGWSDQLFFGLGPRTVVVEFKREGARARRQGQARQEFFRDQFRRRRYEVYKVTGRGEAEAVFRMITGLSMYYREEPLKCQRQRAVSTASSGRRSGPRPSGARRPRTSGPGRRQSR